MIDGAYPYDVKFNIAGGEDIGFMLVTPKGESKQIELKEAGLPNADRGSGDANLQDFSPLIDTVFSMSDFSGGVGQLYYEEGYSNKFFWGTGICHVPGKLYLPPPVTNYALSGVTGNLTNWTTWVHSSGTRYDFMWEGVNLWRRDATLAANAWVKVYAASDPITWFSVMDTVGLICVPAKTGTTDYFYQVDITAAATWAPTAFTSATFVDGSKPSYIIVNRGTAYALVGSNLVYYNVDPTVNSWVGPIDVGTSGNIAGKPGDETYQMKHGRAMNDFLMTFRNDVAYSIDSQQDVEEVIWEWKDKPSAENFRHVAQAGNRLLFNIRTEVRYYDPNTGINRDIGMNIQSGFSVKEVLGLAGDERYVYILAKVRIPHIRSADSVALFRAFPSVDVDYAFEVLWEDTDVSATTYSGLFCSPFGYDARLYWGKNPNAGDSSMNSMLLPTEWDATETTSFATSGVIYTSISKSNYPGFDKRHLYLNVNGKAMSATYLSGVAYTTDNIVTYETLTNMTSDAYSVNFDNEYSKNIGFRFTLTGDGSDSPILTSFDHHQRVRFKYLPNIPLSVRIGDINTGVELRNSAKKYLHPSEWVALITQLRTSAAEILYTDFMGNSFNVSVDAVFFKPTRHEAPGVYEMEGVIVCTRSDKGE